MDIKAGIRLVKISEKIASGIEMDCNTVIFEEQRKGYILRGTPSQLNVGENTYLVLTFEKA